MSALEPYLEALAKTSARELHVRGGERPLWRSAKGCVEKGDVMPVGAGFEALLGELLRAGRASELPADGSDLDFAFVAAGARFRARIYRSEEGYEAVVRSVPAEVPTLEDLGLPPPVLDLRDRPGGLVIISGPPGSGKSTTVASIVEAMNASRRRYIMTVEHPVEYVLDSKDSLVHQLEVGMDVPSHAEGIRTARHAQADVLALDDLPDGECALSVLRAADSGVLVLVTMAANGVLEALDSLFQLLPESERLLNRSCLSQTLAMVLYRELLPGKNGGLVAAHELLVANRAARSMLRDGRMSELASLLDGAGRAMGMINLDDSLEELVKKGLVRSEDALRLARDRVRFQQRAPVS